MKTRSYVMAIAALLALTLTAGAQSAPPAAKNIPDSIGHIWQNIGKDFVALADAMPEDKWSFKPTHGAFQDTRTFAEQVKHVACANEAWAKKVDLQKAPERCDLGGPNPAKSKPELMAYLRDSFAMVDKAIAATNAGNLVQATPGPYWGDTRLMSLTAAVWHVSDHYGQLVEYLRMNDIVPPASR